MYISMNICFKNKEINRSVSEEMSNIYSNSSYWEKLTLPKLWFSMFKRFISRPVFGKLQVTQVSLNFLKIRGLEKKPNKTFLYFIFLFWEFYPVFYVKRRYIKGISRNSRPAVFCEKGVLRNFAKFTGKHLCQSLFFKTGTCGSSN